MGHDIMAHNKEGEMVAYLRYTMSDPNSYEIYDLLEVRNFHGGVSGLGEFADFTRVQIEKALNKFEPELPRYPGDEKFEAFKKNEIKEFLKNCLDTTRKEGIVQIVFA